MIHLHNHTEYSQLDGLGSPSQYAEKAKNLSQQYIAITDHANVDGAIKFQMACNDVGIRSLIGCEFYCVEKPDIMEKGEIRRHLTVLCYSNEGFTNILKLLTIANTKQYYKRPRLSPAQIFEHRNGLIFLSACSSTLLHEKWGKDLFIELKKDTPVFLEVMPHILQSQIETNILCREFGKKERIRLVATNDCHYPEKKYSKAQEVLLCIQRKDKLSNPNHWKFDVDDLYLKTEEEMFLSFKKQGIFNDDEIWQMLKRTECVAKLCNDFVIEKRSVSLPVPPRFLGVDETECLKKLVYDGFEKRMAGKIYDKSVYISRIEEELSLICELGFQRYFLIIFDLIDWCKKNNIMTGAGRGSVGGSLVAYCLNITEVDPIKYKLLFSRFISPARIDLPDVDMDFEDVKRPAVRDYLEKNYGANNVAGITTFLTMKGRCAIRDVSRVFDIPLNEVDKASKCIVVRSGGDFRADFTIEDAFETFEDGKKFKKKYPEVTDIAIMLEGQIRGSGQHAAGICISADDLTQGNSCYLCRRTGGEIVVNWDKTDIEYMGLMKLDILGLSALTRLRMVKDMVKKNRGIDIDFSKIDLDDKKVYEFLKNGNTIGLFQLGSPGLSDYCKKLGIDNFESIVHATSLWRPGTLRSGMAEEFVFRKQGKKFSYIHPLIEELTKDTYGIILYQEQVMNFMYNLAGLGWKTCDTVRKVISKSQGKELFEQFEKLFVEGCKNKNTLDSETASKLWRELANFGSYGFNKSHAVEYSIITFWDAYCKYYFPEEFFCAALTHSDDEKKQELIDDIWRAGLTIVPPKNGHHPTEWTCDIQRKQIFIPLIEIDGIGEKTAQKYSVVKNDGFFENKTNKKIKSILNEIKFFETELPDEKILNKYLKFDLSKDKWKNVRGIIKHMSAAKTLSYLNDVQNGFDGSKIFIGKIPDLKYGYKQNVKNGSSRQSETLGGVYGYFFDENGQMPMVFGNKVYSENKELVEHCENEIICVEAVSAKRASSIIICEKMATMEMMKNGFFNGIKPHIIRPSKRVAVDCFECSNCSLNSSGLKKILPIRGRKNVMIVGDLPEKEDFVSGVLYSGAIGNFVLDTFRLFKTTISRNDLHWSSIVKCCTKNPDKKTIGTCLKHLEMEIEKNEICLILALGGNVLKAFKGDGYSINDLNGTTEWDYKRNLWISWCINPVSILCDEKNKKIFEKGVKNFLETYNNLE